MKFFYLHKKNLLFFTGIVWLFACYMLISRALGWLNESHVHNFNLVCIVGLSLLVALIKIYFIFHKLTLKNISRINSYKGKVHIWNFHHNRDKVIILVMIILGVLLRTSALLPVSVLVVVYSGIGIAMFYVSFMYFVNAFLKNK